MVVAAILAAFAVVTSGASISFAASHLGLPAVRRTAASSIPAAVLCIRASDAAAVADVPALLASHGARATFFLPADVVEGDRGLLSSLSRAGEIQNGGTARAVSRLSTPFEVHRQVAEGSQEIRGATGRTPTYYLPAKGSFNPAAYLGATSAHQRGVVGSLRIHTARGAARTLRPGDVVVLDLTHASGERARGMLATFLDRAQARGLRIVDLSSVGPGADEEP